MMKRSTLPIKEQAALEDVAEEEDVFAAEGVCEEEEEEKREEEAQLSLSGMEAEFVQLTFRKQVSYRRRPHESDAVCPEWPLFSGVFWKKAKQVYGRMREKG
ncbi:uncharacterized protein AB9W97_007930 isoform 2-T2 [Spinachia spinachia]